MNSGRKLSSLWVVLILLATGGCAGGGGSPAPAPAPTSASAPAVSPTAGTAAAAITIKDFAYGEPLTVAPGATISVTNMDTAEHTVTADAGSAFDVEVQGSGGTASFTAPTTPGSYAYHCTYHPNMHGTLIVK